MTQHHRPGPTGDPSSGDASGDRLAVPPDLGRTARGWEEQGVALHGVRARVVDVDVGGFTPAVEGAARVCVAAWERLLGETATAAASCAEGLQATLADYLATDAAVAADHHHLPGPTRWP